MSKILLNSDDLEKITGGSIYAFVEEGGVYISDGSDGVIINYNDYCLKRGNNYTDDRIISRCILLYKLNKSMCHFYKDIEDLAKSYPDKGYSRHNIYRFINGENIGLVI